MGPEFFAAFTSGWPGLASALLFGTFAGFVIGLAPGLGGRIGIILCIPLATFWESIGGAVFLFAMHSVVHTSSSIPAIAFALPSTGADAATVLDGYPLARKGRAGEALGASLSASAIGGVLGALAFLACIPVARLLITWFGPPEFLLLALAGLSMVVFLSGNSVLTGLLTASLGFLAASVGLDVMTSASRFTLERPELLGGLDLAAVIGGIFVVPEMLARWSFDEAGRKRAISTTLRDVLEGMLTTFGHLKLVVRSSLYGIGVGIMPGLGSSVGVWMSYAFASRTVKSDIPFGEGAIAGVIAPEAANNSKEGGAMVPTLFFGIPGSSSMAIMLGALTVVGLPIGPSLLTTDIDVPLTLAATVLLANLIAVPMFLAAVPSIVRLAALRRDHMVPFAIALSLFAAAYQDPHWMTVAQFAAGGVLGVCLKGIGWPRAPFLLGFVIGPLAEISFIQTSQVWGWSMFARPGVLAMLVFFAILLFRAYRSRSRKQARRLGKLDALLALPFAMLFGLALISALSFPGNASQVPVIICVAGLSLAVLVMLSGIWSKGRDAEGPLERFDGLGLTALYIAMVPLLGLPIASAIYVGTLIRLARVGLVTALVAALSLGMVQIWFFSLVTDVFAEPLVTGWALAWAF